MEILFIYCCQPTQFLQRIKKRQLVRIASAVDMITLILLVLSFNMADNHIFAHSVYTKWYVILLEKIGNAFPLDVSKMSGLGLLHIAPSTSVHAW